MAESRDRGQVPGIPGRAAPATPLPFVQLSDPAGGNDAPPRFGEQLRYIGRDYLTGLPATVNDRFIAEAEHAIETYNVEDSKPVPPPPAGDVDISAIAIPALGVSAAVGRYGLDAAGRLDVPQDVRTVGWNPAYCAVPGTGGATLFAAHFYFGGAPGVFNRLSQLQAGDEVTVQLNNGQAPRYRVTSAIDYALAAIDMLAILAGREGTESITLMTCSGPPDEGNYPLRTVVLAEAITA